ncbi:DUF2971 domain-containing protein [Pseudidiomarina donghaiensis]|uniref:DUF2971 domain-containing protein n=2 Tax=Pseudidiomarina donghaiensis TaxID=519452 RepID=A0A432XMZ2_9GAMM|nr:DUF2971 domain-containing protein [Pseudidiomarina donghaiensis]
MDNVVEHELKNSLQTELEKVPAEVRGLIPRAQLEALTMEFYDQQWPKLEKQFLAMGDAFFQTFVQKSNELIGVLSLTEKSNNLLMWSHYARSHKGFCIGFDENDPFFDQRRSDKDEFYYLRKVKYAKDRPTKSMMKLTGTELFLVKSDDWYYEQEWRMCAVLSDAHKTIETGTFPIQLFKFPRGAVKEVILGACMENKLKDKLLNVLREKYEKVVVKQAIISSNEFKLNFVEL